jgi:hypothetical protein
MLSVAYKFFMLSFLMLSVTYKAFILSVIMLSVLAPLCHFPHFAGANNGNWTQTLDLRMMKLVFYQGVVTERENSVQLTSSLR